MAIKFNRQQTFATNGTVTAAALHNLIDGTDIYQALITDQTDLPSVATDDKLLIADASLTAGDAPRSTTVQNLFDDALTGGTYANANISGIITFGTATGNRTISTSATITTGTIPNLTSSTASITLGTIPTLTAGTTTSTAANITNGTIQTLTASTANITVGTYSGAINSTLGTIATLNSTTGTIGTLRSTTGTIATLDSTTGTITGLNTTTGTIATLNSTTGTIANLSTTLAGDFTITQGTGTIGTAKVTPTNLSQPLTLGTSVASTSGTAIDFTSIPSWVKTITISLYNVSFATNDNMLIQLGVGSTPTTSGYDAVSNNLRGGATSAQTSSTSGFVTALPSNASNIVYGTYVITRHSGNLWVGSSIVSISTTANVTAMSNGIVTLSGEIGMVRVRGTLAGTFGGGSVNIMYEG